MNGVQTHAQPGREAGGVGRDPSSPGLVSSTVTATCDPRCLKEAPFPLDAFYP